MNISDFFAILESKIVSPRVLVEHTIGNPRAVISLIEGLFAWDLRIAYECAGLLRLISGVSPCSLYPHYNSLIDLLGSIDPVLRTEAEIILDQLTRVDCLGKGSYLQVEQAPTLQTQ